jgi:hypothetical protein
VHVAADGEKGRSLQGVAVRWWLQNDKPYLFSVDNASVKGMDYSALPPELWMVQWTEGRGEIEYQTPDQQANLNGLRTNFDDVTPYVTYFDQFLTLLQAKGLTLSEAKKVKCDLIDEMFDEKRQAHVHYPVAAGDYHWYADDAATAAMAIQVIPTIFGGMGAGASGTNDLVSQINELVAEINVLIDNINGHEANIIDQVNATVVGGVNSNVVDGTNSALVDRINTYIVTVINNIVTEINARIVTLGNDAFAAIGTALAEVNTVVVAHINTYVVPPFNTLLSYIDTVLVGTSTGTGGGANTINEKLQTSFGDPPHYAAPGLAGPLSHTGIAAQPGSGNISANPYTLSAIDLNAAGVGYLSHIGTLSHLSPLTHVGSVAPPDPFTAGIPWTPVELTSPVTVSIAEISGIMGLIASRRSSLLTVQCSKKNAVNALTTIAAVIAYDVTAGWPAPAP